MEKVSAAKHEDETLDDEHMAREPMKWREGESACRKLEEGVNEAVSVGK
jgi:hypothetical protein